MKMVSTVRKSQGQHARRLRSQEGSPRRARSLSCRLEACLEQHLAHGRRRNRDAEALELTDDSFVAPARVLARELHDQLAQRALKRPSSRAPVGVCPAARNELAVPAKQRSEEHTSELQSRENLVCRL